MSPSDKLTLEYLCKSYPGTVPVKVMTHGDKSKPHMTTVYKNPHKDDSHSSGKFQFLTETDNNTYMDLKTHKFAPIEEIQQKFERSGESDLKSYIHSHYAISDGESQTTKFYRIYRGRYTDARYKTIHKPIIEEKLKEGETPPDNIKPVCFLFGGGSASGKSTVINSIVKPLIGKLPYKFANLDCDEIKSHMPEYQMYQDEGEDPVGRVHRESSDICNECIKAMVQNRKCFTYDGCMSDYRKYRNLIGHLNDAGYEIHIVAVDVPTKMALARAKKRKRQIAEKYIISAHDGFGATFLPLTELKIDSFALYDNSQPAGKPPTCIVNSHGIQNQKLYDRFLKKSEGVENEL